MCTAVSLLNDGHYFGRTLDLEYSLNEAVTVISEKHPLIFRHAGTMEEHYAMIGIAAPEEGFPLYYDAANERGLCIAALNFPGNAEYAVPADTSDTIAPFEVIPCVLGRCASVHEARNLLEGIRVAAIPFSDTLPLTPLHWILSDAKESAVLEVINGNTIIYDNPVGVLTNSPPFPSQMDHLLLYRGLSPETPPCRFGEGFPDKVYSRGMGSFSLPGDFTSASRFVRAAFVKMNARGGSSEAERLGTFFHIMDTVQQVRGTVLTENKEPVITVYTSCYSAFRKLYCYTTYENRQITAVDFSAHELTGNRIYRYPLLRAEQIRFEKML